MTLMGCRHACVTNCMLNELQSVEAVEIGRWESGRILMTQFDPNEGEYVVWVEKAGRRYMIPASELELFPISGNLYRYVGQRVEFAIVSYDVVRDVYIGSVRTVKEVKRNDLIDKLEAGEVFDARVVKFVVFGAYLKIQGVYVILRNQEFSNDYTTVSDVYNIGDIIKVKLNRVTLNNKIQVELVNPHISTSNITIVDFKPDMIVYGLIRNIKAWGCFVSIAPNLDAICPVPYTLDVKEGMKVAFKINQVRVDENKVRGKIIKIIDPQTVKII